MNKPTMKNILAISTLAIALPFAAVSYADGGKHCDMHGKQSAGKYEKGAGYGAEKGGVPPHLQALNLTQDQKDKVFAIMHEQAPAMYESRKQERAAMETLRTVAAADVYDDAKAQQVSDQLAQLEKNKALSHARTEAKVMALLTPEQRQKAREQKMADNGARREHDMRDGRDGKPEHDMREPVRYKQSNPAAVKSING